FIAANGEHEAAYHVERAGPIAVAAANGFQCSSDFNGDGRNDSGALALWLMNGAVANGVVIGFSEAAWQVAGVGDYNGDGRDDILWLNDDDTLAAWFMNGAVATGHIIGNVSDDWSILPGGG
ncbi:MAG: hypothetical protein DCF16_14230, partial [Alphaproteobacteria bacterium]